MAKFTRVLVRVHDGVPNIFVINALISTRIVMTLRVGCAINTDVTTTLFTEMPIVVATA